MTITPPPPAQPDPAQPQGPGPVPPAAAGPAAPAPTLPYGSPLAPEAPRKSVLPLLSIIFAGVAFLLAVIPPTSGFAWVFAITAIVLAIIALVKKAQPKGLAIAAIIVAPVAWLVSIIVFVVAVAAGIGDISTTPQRPGGTVAQSEQPAAEEQEEETPDTPVADGSSLNAPLPFGSSVSVDAWTGSFDVSFGAINWDATAVIDAENQFNIDPSEGMKYIMIPVTITNTDDEEWNASGTFFWADIKLVSDGRGFSEGTIVVTPDDLGSKGDLYPGGTVTGNVVFEVPADVASGVWDVDGVFVSAQ